ncbi:unnamed protein product, partial [Iphiclides podalirius]
MVFPLVILEREAASQRDLNCDHGITPAGSIRGHLAESNWPRSRTSNVPLARNRRGLQALMSIDNATNERQRTRTDHRE